jgi:putative ABC transport system permease protein
MWKNKFRTRKVQTVMIFLVIMLCSALLTGAVSILISLDKPFDNFSKECDAAASVLYPYSREEKDISTISEKFSKLHEVKRVEYSKFYFANEEVTAKGQKIEAFIRLLEYNDSVFSKVRYLEGDKNSARELKDGECIIPACIGIYYDIHVGDVINFNLPTGKKDYGVKGIFTDPYDTSKAYSCDILINKVPESLNPEFKLFIYGKDGIKGNDIQTAYREKNDGQMGGTMFTLEESISGSLITGNVLGAVFLAIGIIMLFVSALIIHFMVRNAMITDAKDIAVYKTIGYTSKDILKMYMIFYFIIVTVASFIGIIGSVFLSNEVLTTIYENIGQGPGVNVIIPGILCYFITVSFVLFVIWIIVGRTKKVKPVAALTGMTTEGIKKKKKYKGNSKLQFSSFGIALRNITRGGKGIIGIVITCIVTIFAINFAIISIDLANTMKDNNDYWLGVDKCNVSVGVTDAAKFNEVYNVIKADERVNYLIKSNYHSTVTLKWKAGMTVTYMDAFVYEDFSKVQLPLVEGRNPNSGNEIALASKMAGELNKKIGDYVEVYLEGNKKVDLLITGIFQTYYEMGSACRLTTAVYMDNDYKLDYDTISIYLKENKNTTIFMEDIKNKIGDKGKVTLRTELFASIMDMIVMPQQKAIPPVIILVLLLGSINIFCIVLLKNSNAQRTNGIYKCIGYSTGHLIKSNLYYVGIIAVVSIAVALPITIWSYPSIMKLSLSTFGFLEYPVTYIWSHIALTNIGVVGIFVVSTLISSWSLRKVNARDLVQE